MESGINAALTVASSWKAGDALHEAEIRLLTVQNAENPSVREGKMRLN